MTLAVISFADYLGGVVRISDDATTLREPSETALTADRVDVA